jgi:tRNA threonylcarbamoyladenosine biosynthesis protein TsaE
MMRTTEKSRRGRAASRIRLVQTGSPEETERLGRELAAEISVPGVVLLCGELGTGKTTLTRGLAQGLGLQHPELVHSPSFTIVNIYQGRCPIYHVDLYRLAGRSDLRSIGLEDFLGVDGITIVEWGERLGNPPAGALRVDLEDSGGDTRTIKIRWAHPQVQSSES